MVLRWKRRVTSGGGCSVEREYTGASQSEVMYPRGLSPRLTRHRLDIVQTTDAMGLEMAEGGIVESGTDLPTCDGSPPRHHCSAKTSIRSLDGSREGWAVVCAMYCCRREWYRWVAAGFRR